MFEKFTARSRRVIEFAKDEARRLNHGYLGTEHVLIGLIKDPGGVASEILKSLNLDLHKLRTEVERVTKLNAPLESRAKPEESPDFRALIEAALKEARGLGHHYTINPPFRTPA